MGDYYILCDTPSERKNSKKKGTKKKQSRVTKITLENCAENKQVKIVQWRPCASQDNNHWEQPAAECEWATGRMKYVAQSLPVMASLADHFDVPSSTLCLTAFMWPACDFLSTPKTFLHVLMVHGEWGGEAEWKTDVSHCLQQLLNAKKSSPRA